MALEAALETLVRDLEKLHGILHDLNINAGDVGEADGARLADDVAESITELAGLSEGALSLAREAREAAGPAFDPNKLRRSLGESQKQFHTLKRTLFSELLSYERVSELVQFGRERKRWLGWVNSVRQGLERCRPAVDAVEEGYFGFWREMAERVSSGPIAMHTTNIGQQITTEALATREATRTAMHEGIT